MIINTKYRLFIIASLVIISSFAAHPSWALLTRCDAAKNCTTSGTGAVCNISFDCHLLTATDTVTITVTGPDVPPTDSSVKATEPDYCASGATATIDWKYTDKDDSPIGTDPQSAFEIQVSTLGSFASGSIDFDSGKITQGGTVYTIPQGYLDFNVTYKARVKVWDSHDAPSDWGVSGSWKSPKHAYPQVDFSWSPLNPIVNQNANFSDETIFYDAGAGHTWTWTFGDGTTLYLQNPIHKFAAVNSYNVKLTAKDVDNFSCSLSKLISVGNPLPYWREVSPK